MNKPNPDPAHLRELAERIVRHVAAGAGLATLVTIGASADLIPIVTHQGFNQRRANASYEGLLAIVAGLVRQSPRGTPTMCCALILPEQDVAYLHHHDTGTDPADVLAVGANPVDLPSVRLEVSRGLATLMQALADTQQRPPAVSAFLADPTARIGLIASPIRPDPPAPGGPKQRGAHR